MTPAYFWKIPLLIFILILSCSVEEGEMSPEPGLSEFDREVIDYFKEIALGFENGNASEITRKWRSPMRIFVEGDVSPELINRVEETIAEINGLASDGFSVELVGDSISSNCYLFFGTASEFSAIFPDTEGQIGTNFAIFNVWWNDNIINRARIFIDTHRPNLAQQESLIVEEITQSLGLGKDSPRYPTSIFYETPSNGGFASGYSTIDKEVIRLLYHPDMTIGLNEMEVEELLETILTNE